MRIIGFSGSFDLIDESRYGSFFWHDAAAALVEDGEVLFATEEERLNRIKHSNKFPILSIGACLRHAGIQLEDIDLFAYYCHDVDILRKERTLQDPFEPLQYLDKAAFVQERFRCAFGKIIDKAKFRFVNHHYAHAASTFAVSGFDDALVLTLDGAGDDVSGIVLEATRAERKALRTLSLLNSLGLFYGDLIRYLGYTWFDEYKVMGLAPYGDPKRFRSALRSLYSLLPNGEYEIHYQDDRPWLFDKLLPRRKTEPFTQTHKDFAAALQESLEEMAFHILRHFKSVTQQKNLCLAGGVAQNCTLNGKILRSGLFDNVFIQPAAHDSGCALGAALHTDYEMTWSHRRSSRLAHVFWGEHIGDDKSIERHLARWRDLIEFRKEEKIEESTAELLANDSVVGWVQGRSEFGPRALGNRSILADPRPAHNKDRINQLVKKREAYRPFAPSVLEEEADKFFDVRPAEQQLEFMLYVVYVKEDKRPLLGAITHVDGTARIQTVSRKTNLRFWKLIEAFGARTGVPIVLNTSFNNNTEPIVDSIDDAVSCFLTTGLDHLVVGDYLIRKKPDLAWRDYLKLKVSLPRSVSLYHKRAASSAGTLTDSFYVGITRVVFPQRESQQSISPRAYAVLSAANTNKSLGELLDAALTNSEDARSVVEELLELWSLRLIRLVPVE